MTTRAQQDTVPESLRLIAHSLNRDGYTTDISVGKVNIRRLPQDDQCTITGWRLIWSSPQEELPIWGKYGRVLVVDGEAKGIQFTSRQADPTLG